MRLLSASAKAVSGMSAALALITFLYIRIQISSRRFFGKQGIITPPKSPAFPDFVDSNYIRRNKSCQGRLPPGRKKPFRSCFYRTFAGDSDNLNVKIYAIFEKELIRFFCGYIIMIKNTQGRYVNRRSPVLEKLFG
jgi:hypothetical protein